MRCGWSSGRCMVIYVSGDKLWLWLFKPKLDGIQQHVEHWKPFRTLAHVWCDAEELALKIMKPPRHSFPPKFQIYAAKGGSASQTRVVCCGFYGVFSTVIGLSTSRSSANTHPLPTYAPYMTLKYNICRQKLYPELVCKIQFWHPLIQHTPGCSTYINGLSLQDV